ncbi:hypothetical protein Tco_0770267 [Tanacetum coccineum]|uniref:Calmodulin-binding domain-containing protein n=1 Tax=Tanacetum coccineum TaxID=301880 RepID=A0ABQ4ZEC7_9ASTR
MNNHLPLCAIVKSQMSTAGSSLSTYEVPSLSNNLTLHQGPSPRPSPDLLQENLTTSIVSDQAKEIKLLKAQITKLKKQAKPVISIISKHIGRLCHCSIDSQESSSRNMEAQRVYKIDHKETENAQSEGRTREMVDEDKEIDEVRLSTEDVVSTDKERVSTDFEKDVSTNLKKFVVTSNSTEEQKEGTEEKVESTAGQRKIDPKDKGKKKIEEEDESESEDDDIPQAVKKFKQLESDEARIEADRILAEKLQEQEREQFTIEERAKFLHDTIAAQRKFLAQQRSEAS